MRLTRTLKRFKIEVRRSSKPDVLRTYRPIGKGMKADFHSGLDGPLAAGGLRPFEQGVIDLHRSLGHDTSGCNVTT